ncbi:MULTISPECIES: beta-1,6-N-acetylglucosaminyltransferase [Cyanophyceae]|uniref:beta-1,6-N-acetylglucosaminyltransferase n=1 Tax=Cyanophyceae TaxID=3028117 RepID=UPI0016886080|nr:beta-1,6-N-acetylglucosaminyltransferase [Trichocoleus sp. FACHB-40]MBD2007124.1 hypothetical protein [Trichocoleus sp. FACHB-40]
MKIAYLIQTYKNPEQIYRLVHIIKKSSPNSFVLVSHNFAASNLNVELLENLPDVKVVSAIGGRGNFALVQAYLEAIDWLLNNKIEFDWLINITGQDYPTQPLPEIENFLAETTYDGFFDYFNVLSEKCTWGAKDGRDRYFYQYWWSGIEIAKWQRGLLKPLRLFINNIQPWFRIDFSYGLIVGMRSLSTPFNENFLCYGGSYFKTISRNCVQYIHEFCQQHPELIDYYKKTRLPDESFIQTILINSGLFNFYPRNMRYIDWTNSRHGHPAILTIDYYPKLIRDDIYFARKFEIDRDSRILDRLDERIMQTTVQGTCSK